MGLILAVQFYFAYQARQELLGKLTQLSDRINQAIDLHYQTVLREIREKETGQVSAFRMDLDTVRVSTAMPSTGESLYREVIAGLKSLRKFEKMNQDSLLLIRTPYRVYDEEAIRSLSSQAELLKRKFSAELEIMKSKPDFQRQLHEETRMQLSGQPAGDLSLPAFEKIPDHWPDPVEFEMIDVDLNPLQQEIDGVVVKIARQPRTSLQIGPNKKITIRIPDFSLPHAPKMVRYNYRVTELEEAVKAAFHRNIMVTVLLFAMSIIAIIFISRRFLQPIALLKSSFQQVVQGDLEVRVPSRSRDEIGELSTAFNQMVTRLNHNREKEKLLKRREKLASMGQLAAGVAHEIKNPLNAIHLTMEQLRDKYAGTDETVQGYIRNIQNEIQRLDKLVNNFLNFVRSEDLEKMETDLNQLVSEVLQLMQQEIAWNGITVETDFKQPFPAKIDREGFKTVLLNVILNAIHAMPQGGTLGILTCREDGEILIQDTGVGIPAAELDKIFDLFYTTKSKGTGLGLPTAYKIIREHGGNIRIESQVGKGTLVRITLGRGDDA